MKTRCRCKHCHCLFSPNPRVRNQRYCSQKACQRARKSQWHRQKMKTDPDYRRNQKESQEKWRQEHPEYWREYRKNHCEYRERNRQEQRNRDKNRREKRLAKMDAIAQLNQIKAGCYYLIPVSADLAKKDVSVREIYIIPMGYNCFPPSCKEGLDVHCPRGLVG